jgi:hypothetical protein
MGCYKWYESRPSKFHGRVWVRGLGIWCIAHVGPVWSHGMTYDNTRHTDLAKGEIPGLGLIDEDVGLLRRVDCDILASRMVISWPKA